MGYLFEFLTSKLIKIIGNLVFQMIYIDQSECTEHGVMIVRRNFPSVFWSIRMNGVTRRAEIFLKLFDQSKCTNLKRTACHPIKRSAAGRRPAKFLITIFSIRKDYSPVLECDWLIDITLYQSKWIRSNQNS